MTVKINQKIVGYTVAKNNEEETERPAKKETKAEVIHMHEKVDRPEGLEPLEGATYKIKTPLEEHALYVTINDIILNAGTEHESRRPFEIFINSKNMDHFQWIVALTRVMSAVFRKGGDVTFLAEELQAVFDPRGGYFKSGGKFMPSLVAEIGEVVEKHMKRIGLLEDDEMSDERKALIEQKRADYEARTLQAVPDSEKAEDATYPDGATLCGKCNTKAMVMMDGCETCLSCGDSKCG